MRANFLTRRGLIAGGGAALAMMSPAVLRGAAAVETLAGRAFAVDWRLTLPAGRGADRLRRPVAALLDRFDRELSPWRPDSAVGRFNAAPAGLHPMPAEACIVAGAALRIAAESGGTFDPTVGPLVARWGFGPIAGDSDLDWRALRLEGEALAKAVDGATFDPCGIAKGRALDLMGGLLLAEGERDFLIELGGELVARGQHPSGRPWQVAVEDPVPGGKAPGLVLRLADAAVATSGSREQSYRLGSHLYSHIADPQQRAPADAGLASVTVIAPDAMTADGWATALAAAGAAAGPGLAERLGIPAVFLMAGNEARRVVTGAMSSYIA